MENVAELKLDGRDFQLPIIEGTEKERAFDISALRNNTGYITLDDGYANTGSCQSRITFIDGEQGILRYGSTIKSKLTRRPQLPTISARDPG